MTSGQLLTRLLLAASPALAAACSADPALSGASGYGSGAPRSDGASAGVPGRPDTTPAPVMLEPLDPPTPSGHRAVRPPPPPLKPSGPVGVVDSTAEQPGEQPLAICTPEYYSWPDNASGGPFPLAACYQPASQPHACVEATAPQLPRLLGGKLQKPTCVYGGPHAQTDPDSGAPWCCYSLGWMGTGRPLVIERPRVSPLAAREEWA